MELDGDVERSLELLHEVFCDIRLQEAGHVLDADGVAAHLLQFLGKIDEDFVRMIGAERVDEAALYMWLFFAAESSIDRCLEVAHVVQRVEDAEYAHAMLGSLLDELLDDIVRIVVVAEQVLTTKQHLDRSLETGLELVESLPRIFVEEAKARIKGRTAPGFKRVVADLVERCKHRLHLGVMHARRTQGLMPVAKYCFCDFYLFCHKKTHSFGLYYHKHDVFASLQV